MKSRINPFIRFSTLLTAATIALAASAQAADFTWAGTTGNWNDASWNPGPVAGPVTAGNTATINSGIVNVNVGGTGSLDSITLGSGAQMNVYNGDGGIYAYTTFANLILQGGTLNGGSATYHTYGTSMIGNLTVSGSAASTITSGSWFNLVPSTTFTVADVTTGADLLVNSRMYAPPLDGNDNAWGTAALTKEGLGTMRLTLGTYNVNVTVNAGTLEFVGEAEAGAGGGYGFVRNGTITVNSGATLSLTGSGTGFGWRTDNPSSITINGGTITSGTNHVFDIGGGVNMTGGLLDSTTGSFQWKGTPLNTLASASTATIAGGLNLRTDFGTFNQTINVADGAAATDLLISANITQPNVNSAGITKSGLGTMELSGARSYTGSTVVSAGTLVLSGANSSSASSTIVNATGTLKLTAPVLNDVAPVVIASGAQVVLNFAGSDTVGSLDINGSGPLPAGLYNSLHPTYGSYFTGTGSLAIAGANGTWTSLANGNWSGAANWASSTIAVGLDATATFNAATGVTVTVDSDRLIGNLAFSVSDYTLAGANTLTLQASSTPIISVASGRTATIAANLGGTGGMEKTGLGKLVLDGAKSYTGGTVVNGGTLELAGATGGVAPIHGSLNINTGATVALTGGDGTGFGWSNSPVTSIYVDNGTLNASGGCHLGFGAAATLTLDNGSSVQGSWNWNGDGLLSFFSNGEVTNTISGSLTLRGDAGASHTFTVSDGAAATDLQVNANLTDQWPAINWVPASGLTKAGGGTMVLNGTNSYDGNTVVNDGALNVTATSSLHFSPTTNGVTNSVSGSGTGSLSFLGTVDLDLTAANTTGGNVWNLFNLPSFAVTPSLSGTAAVTSTLGAFIEGPSGTWKLGVSGAEWVFTESNGNLAYVVTATPYQTWGAAYGLTAGSEGGDLDNDGLTNFQEFAFGLIPNSGSSVNPITVQLTKSSGQFTYQRLNGSGLTYTIWTSPDLITWTEDTTATAGQSVTTGSPNDSVQVTLTGALPLTADKLFVRVKAQ